MVKRPMPTIEATISKPKHGGEDSRGLRPTRQHQILQSLNTSHASAGVDEQDIGILEGGLTSGSPQAELPIVLLLLGGWGVQGRRDGVVLWHGRGRVVVKLLTFRHGLFVAWGCRKMGGVGASASPDFGPQSCAVIASVVGDVGRLVWPTVSANFRLCGRYVCGGKWISLSGDSP